MIPPEPVAGARLFRAASRVKTPLSDAAPAEDQSADKSVVDRLVEP